jgi:hypothetical protein
MTQYDGQLYQPPAPTGALTLRTLDGTNRTVDNVKAILDTGADVTLLPRWAIDQLGLIPEPDATYSLEWFDGSLRAAESVVLEALFQGGRFQGRYALIDQQNGVIGRNLLNHFRMLFDGPAKTWQRV